MKKKVFVITLIMLMLVGAVAVTAQSNSAPWKKMVKALNNLLDRSDAVEEQLGELTHAVEALQSGGCDSGCPTPTSAAVDMFIKIEGIEGESRDADHDKWIDILSFNQPIHRPGVGATGQSRRRGAAVVEDIVVVKELDKSSPKLAESLLQGQVIPKVELELTATYGGARATYYQYELKNVMVTSYSVGGSSGEDRPTESVSLNFEEIKVTYTEFDDTGSSKGTVEYSWKVEEGEN